MVILHYTAMPDTQAVVDRLCDPTAQVSAHYVISPQGDLIQLVPEHRRAWHAGASHWAGQDDINSVSIGIELVNDGFSPFAAPLMNTCEALVAEVMARWGIPPQRVLGHSDVSPGRKIDPGPRFDWRRLARQGLAVCPETVLPGTGDETALAKALAQIGYAPDMALEPLLGAFRARVRPWAKGPADGWDLAYAQDLARRYPVDVAAYPA